MIKALKAKVFCVDDDRRNLKLLAALLEPEGYRVELFESGAEVLGKVSLDLPDVVLLDIIMPVMSGIDVLKRLRADSRANLVPVILLTALRQEEDRIRGIEAGCDDFISKPFDKAELLARVRSLVQMSFYRRQLDEREKFHTVVAEMSDGVVVFSPDWRVVDINGSARRFLGSDFEGDSDFLGSVVRNFTVSVSREELMDKDVTHKDFEIMRPESVLSPAFYLEVSMDLLKNISGMTSSIIWVLRDVSQARKEEIIKRTFLKFISHKMRQPLTVILDGLSMLKDEFSDDRGGQRAEIYRAVSEKALQLDMRLERLIKFAAITEENIGQKRESIDPRSYIPVLIDPLISSVKDKKIDLFIDCVDGSCVSMIVYKVYFDLIIENLVENAIKFNDLSQVTIVIKVRSLADKIEFSVSDNGRGIPAEEQGKIFEKFYQPEKYFTGQVEGVGLGLPLVKFLVERLGGTIVVTSGSGKGATFTFTLPKNV